MSKKNEQGDVQRVILLLNEAMKALVARQTIAYDNELAATQSLIAATFRGWDPQDVPANLQLLMRDLAIHHDDKVQSETFRLAEMFAKAEQWIREATGLSEEQPRVKSPRKTAKNAATKKRARTRKSVRTRRVKTQPKARAQTQPKMPAVEMKLNGATHHVARVLQNSLEPQDAVSLDVVAKRCEKDARQQDVRKALDGLERVGVIVRVGDKYMATPRIQHYL